MTSDFRGKIKGNGKMGHAFEQRTDPKQNESDKFARQIANYLEDAHNTNKFNRLLLIAEPSFLGLLRKNFSERIRKLVALELDKNITTHCIGDIRKYLASYLHSTVVKN
jgi:protein required for attachment to host cells